jgi:nucleotide-binding universal stress UspA family protein
MYDPAMAGMESAFDPRIRDQEKSYLEGVAKRVSASSSLQVHPILLDGIAADSIRERAQATGSDLIVMTTHGRGPLSRFWLGSVADQLVRRSPVPILLVHPSSGAPDLTSDTVLLRILIPLDGSELAEQILQPAIDLGRLMDADYTLLRVVEPVGSVAYDAPMYVLPSDARRADQDHREAQVYLERVAERFRRQSLSVRIRVLTSPHPATSIIDEGMTDGAQLIALQTHGRRGLARILLGSVADKVVRGASMPVLVFRPGSKITGELL